MRPPPALRTLMVLKWRGLWRRQGRRLKTFKGAVLTILGVALVFLLGVALYGLLR